MRPAARLLAVAALGAGAGCADLVQYAQDLGDSSTGRTLFVRTPAQLCGIAGFGIGVPVSIVLLPVTYVTYRLQVTSNEATADPVSTLLLPSFVLWRAGTLLAAPFDLVEYLAWRAWRDPVSMSRAQREALEAEFDRATLPSYPVEPVYPPPSR